MPGFTAKEVKTLREQTGAGMMDCKKALTEAGGDMKKAMTWLREKGIADAEKRQDRTAVEGAVASYLHMGGKIGVLVEVNCETDFVARGDEFQDLCRDLCLQVCSTAPQYVSQDEVPESAVEKEREVFKARARDMGKPENILPKIAEGMLSKWYEEVCLLQQKFVKDPDRTVEDLVKEFSGKVGEKIVVRRFARFQLGEDLENGEESGRSEDVAQQFADTQG
ncbi:MAG: translation elongation factor Ts [Candidatus Hydrogenedentota bacterium]